MNFDKFFKGFQKSKKEHEQKHAILPVSYMIKINAQGDFQNVNALRTLANDIQLPHPEEEMHFDQDHSNDTQAIIYFSIYGFELFAQGMKQRILEQAPLNQDASQSFNDVDVDLDIINNKFSVQENEDENGDNKDYTFLDSNTSANFSRVPLHSDFVNATYLINRLLFLNYSVDALDENNVDDEYNHLVTLAQKVQKNYRLQNDIDDSEFATIPSEQDFEKQNADAIYVPSLSLSSSSEIGQHPSDQSDDNDDIRDDQSHPHDDNQDVAQSLTNNADEDEDTDVEQSNDTADSKDKSNVTNDNAESNNPSNTSSSKSVDESTNEDTAVNNSNTTHDSPTARTVGEIRKEQQAHQKNEKEASTSSSSLTPEDVIKSIYAPHIYDMNVQFPQFTVDMKMDKPPKLEEAVKNNEFDDQLYVVQEINQIKKQANDYLAQEAQQVSRNFNFDMGRTVMQVYKQLNDKIHHIQQEGKNDDALNRSVQDYYEKQTQDIFADLKQSKDDHLEQRLTSLQKEYEQKKQDLINQSDQQYETDRAKTKTRIQADTERIRHDNMTKRNQNIDQQIAQSRERAEQYLSHIIQQKADKYKDMADNLGQSLFASLQNHVNALYPKLINHVSVLMNQQLQLNYSTKRLNESNASVYQKKLSNVRDELNQYQTDHTRVINDYENRIQNLHEQLQKRDNTSKGYDKLLSEKNNLQDDLNRVQQQMSDQQQENKKLNERLKDVPTDQPEITAKARSTEINYKSLQKNYQELKDVNTEYRHRIDSLQRTLDSKKHFWNK